MIALLAVAAVAAPLTLDELHAGLDGRVPEIAVAVADAEAATAGVRAARGAFEPIVDGKLEQEVVGPYPRQLVTAQVAVPTAIGVDVAAGWDLGVGEWPDYYGGYVTSEAGEAWAQVTVPVLRGLVIDEARANRLMALADEARAGELLAFTRIAVRAQAESAYWTWVAAGAARQVALDQLALAETRQTGIEREAAEGTRAARDVTDNLRAVLTRKRELLVAEQKLGEAAVKLSLFVRDDAMRPVVPAPDRLPELSELPPPPAPASVDLLTERADLAAVRAKLDAVAAKRRSAVQKTLPKIDLVGRVAQELGPVAKDPTEVTVGAALSVAPLARTAQAEVARLDAERTRLLAELRQKTDKLIATARQMELVLGNTHAAFDLSSQALDAARQVAALERRAFELGVADLLDVAQREQVVAKEAKARIEAWLAHQQAATAWRATTAGPAGS